MNLAPADLVAGRLARLRERAVAAGCDAFVVTHVPNVFYLTNFSGGSGLAVVSPEAVRLVVDFRYLGEAERALASCGEASGISVARVDRSYDATLAEVLASLGARRIGFEATRLTVSRHIWLTDRIGSGASLVPTSGLVERLRERKDSYEIAALRRAARLLSEVAGAVVDRVQAGQREREVAALIDATLRRMGFARPAFDTIVGSGPNGALPHAPAGDRIIERGDLVVLDFGGVCDGYCVDLTRTVSVGQAGAEARRVHAAVLAAQAAAIATVRPGATTGQIDAAARAVMERAGLGEAFGHGTGHGLGIEVHEDPRLSRSGPAGTGAADAASGESVVEAGMVFTIEPGAYLPGWGGVRIEDDVLVTDDGCEVLTTASRDLVESRASVS